MKMNQIAAQLYTVRDYCQNKKDYEETMKKLQEIGYKAVQLSAIGFDDYEFIKQIADENDIKICGTHTNFDRLMNDYKGVVDEHRTYDCNNVGIGYMPMKYSRDKAGYEEFAKDINILGEKFLKEGMHLAYHNHRFEFEKYDGITGMEIILNNTDPRYVGFIIDSYWVVAGAQNPVDWVYKVKDRMDLVHFKDMTIKSDNQIMTEVGEGNLDWKSIIKACDETNVRWAAVEQDICPGNPFDSLKTSYENLRNMLE